MKMAFAAFAFATAGLVIIASPAEAANTYLFDITPLGVAPDNEGADPTIQFSLTDPITGFQGWSSPILGQAAVSLWPETGSANGGLVGFFGYDYAGRDGYTLRIGEGSPNDQGLYLTADDPFFTTSSVSGSCVVNSGSPACSVSIDVVRGSPFTTTLTNTGWATPGYGNTDMLTITAVPEPSTWALMLVGLAGLGYAARRQAKRRDSIAVSRA